MRTKLFLRRRRGFCMRRMLRGTRAARGFRRCGLTGVRCAAVTGGGRFCVRGVRAGSGLFGRGSRAGDLVRAACSCLSVATVAHTGSDKGRFGNVETVACLDLDAGGGELVPAAELGKGDTEAVRDGHQGVAAAGGVVDGVRRWGSRWGYGHYERLDAIELGAVAELIDGSDLARRDTVGVGDGGKRVFGCDLVIAPGVALAFRDGGDLVLKQRGCAGRQVEVERGVWWSDEPQQAGIEGYEFIYRCANNIGHQTEIGRVVDG